MDEPSSRRRGDCLPVSRKPIIAIDGSSVIHHIRRPSKEELHTFAASAATEAEERIAKTKFADGSKPVQVPKRVWRPQVKNEYREPEVELDEEHDWLFQDLGKIEVI